MLGLSIEDLIKSDSGLIILAGVVSLAVAVGQQLTQLINGLRSIFGVGQRLQTRRLQLEVMELQRRGEKDGWLKEGQPPSAAPLWLIGLGQLLVYHLPIFVAWATLRYWGKSTTWLGILWIMGMLAMGQSATERKAPEGGADQQTLKAALVEPLGWGAAMTGLVLIGTLLFSK